MHPGGESETQKARREGERAFHDGRGIGACRHDDPLRRTAFRHGWIDARDDAVRKLTGRVPPMSSHVDARV